MGVRLLASNISTVREMLDTRTDVADFIRYGYDKKRPKVHQQNFANLKGKLYGQRVTRVYCFSTVPSRLIPEVRITSLKLLVAVKSCL